MIFLYCNDKDSIRVLRKSSMILERLWKVLGALLCLLIHAWGCWIVNTTGTMDHKLLDQLKIALVGCLDWRTLQREDCLCAEEEVSPAVEIMVYSKSVLTGGLHMPGAACEGGRKDNPGANLSGIKLWILFCCS